MIAHYISTVGKRTLGQCRNTIVASNARLGSRRQFAKETKQAFQPPPDAPSNNPKYALVIGGIGVTGLIYLFNTERNDYGISWYVDDGTMDESKMPVARPGSDGNKTG